jgi:hypothetical protein
MMVAAETGSSPSAAEAMMTLASRRSGSAASVAS